MTVIAWDGKILAADSLAINAGLKTKFKKIRVVNEYKVFSSELTGRYYLMACAGDAGASEAMFYWYERYGNALGTKEIDESIARFPHCQTTNDWARLIVVRNQFDVFMYEQTPHLIKVHEPFAAWGSGRDYALAAMECGKGAIDAVRVACKFDSGCSEPIDKAIGMDPPLVIPKDLDPSLAVIPRPSSDSDPTFDISVTKVR